MPGRRPDYRVSALDRDTEETNVVGGAWINADKGTISIRLDAFIVLRGKKSLMITLFPNDGRKGGSKQQDDSDDSGEDIPF